MDHRFDPSEADERRAQPALDRRRFFAAVAATGTAALAGCTGSPLETTALDWTGESVGLDGLERHQLFGGDEPAFVVTVRQAHPTPDDGRATPVPFSLLFHHRDDLRTDGLRLRLRAPPGDGSAFDAGIYLRSAPRTSRSNS